MAERIPYGNGTWGEQYTIDRAGRYYRADGSPTGESATAEEARWAWEQADKGDKPPAKPDDDARAGRSEG